MNRKTKFERAIEEKLGETVEEIRAMPIDERRRRVERKFSRAMEVESYFPAIGRGNVLGDRLISHNDVEKELEKAL